MRHLFALIVLLLVAISFIPTQYEYFKSLPPYHLVWMGKKKKQNYRTVPAHHHHGKIPEHCASQKLKPQSLQGKTLAEQCEIKKKYLRQKQEEGLCHGKHSSVQRLGRSAYQKCLENGGDHKRCSCYSYCLCVNKGGDPIKCLENPVFRSCVATDHDEPSHKALADCD